MIKSIEKSSNGIKHEENKTMMLKKNMVQQNLRISKLACLHCIQNETFNSSQKLYNFFWANKLVKTKTNFHFSSSNMLRFKMNAYSMHYSDSFETMSAVSAIFFQFHFISFTFISLSNSQKNISRCTASQSCTDSHTYIPCSNGMHFGFSATFSLSLAPCLFLIQSSFRVWMSDICVECVYAVVIVPIIVPPAEWRSPRMNPAWCWIHAVGQQIVEVSRWLSPPFHLIRPSKCWMCHSNFSRQKCNLF